MKESDVIKTNSEAIVNIRSTIQKAMKEQGITYDDVLKSMKEDK